MQDLEYLYNTDNETAGALVPAQIIYDAFYGRFHNSAGPVVFLCIIWGSFFFCGLSTTTTAARVVRKTDSLNLKPQTLHFFLKLKVTNFICFADHRFMLYQGIKVHPKSKVPANAVWLCAAIGLLLGLPILKLDVVFTTFISVSTIGWVGSYAVPIFARLMMSEENFKPGPFYLGRGSRPGCLVAFLVDMLCMFSLPAANFLPS